MENSLEHVRLQIRKAIDSLYKTDFNYAKEIVIEGIIGITLDRCLSKIFVWPYFAHVKTIFEGKIIGLCLSSV